MASAMVWTFGPPLRNSHGEILMSNVIVLEDGAFGRCLGHEEETLVNRIRVTKETSQSSLALLPCDKVPAINQEEDSYQNVTMLPPWSWTPSLLWQINFSVYKLPSCGILLEQPKTASKHMKRCWTSLAIREMRTDTTM